MTETRQNTNKSKSDFQVCKELTRDTSSVLFILIVSHNFISDVLKSYKSAAWAHCNPVVVWSSQLVWGSSYTHLKLNIEHRESFHNVCDHLRASNQISHSIAIYRGGKNCMHANNKVAWRRRRRWLTFNYTFKYSNLWIYLFFLSIRIWNPIPISFIALSQ